MGKKKVGIITFHSAINYGAVLQAVALENAFRSKGIACEIIDYRNERFERQYGLQTKFGTVNIFKKSVLFILKNHFFLQKKKKFIAFLNNHSRMSKEKYDYNSVVNIVEDYNYFVTGSDQVFNLALTDGDTRYFLDFVPSYKKRSYAASFGKKEIEKENYDSYQNLLQDFQEISLREATAKNICHELKLNMPLAVHVDPTLLFNGEWWSAMCTDMPKEKYILFYKVAVPEELISYVENFSKKTGLKVIEIGSDLKKSSDKFSMIRNAGPEDFVSLIKNAEYVATTSFHAAVFSILFHKKMILELTDALGKFNVRIDNLLTSVGIQYNDDKIVTISNLDWNQVDILLQNQRDKAYEYIEYMK